MLIAAERVLPPPCQSWWPLGRGRRRRHRRGRQGGATAPHRPDCRGTRFRPSSQWRLPRVGDRRSGRCRHRDPGAPSHREHASGRLPDYWVYPDCNDQTQCIAAWTCTSTTFSIRAGPTITTRSACRASRHP